MKDVGEDGWGRGGKIRDWDYWEYAYTPILYIRTMESAIQRRLSLPTEHGRGKQEATFSRHAKVNCAHYTKPVAPRSRDGQALRNVWCRSNKQPYCAPTHPAFLESRDGRALCVKHVSSTKRRGRISLSGGNYPSSDHRFFTHMSKLYLC